MPSFRILFYRSRKSTTTTSTPPQTLPSTTITSPTPLPLSPAALSLKSQTALQLAHLTELQHQATSTSAHLANDASHLNPSGAGTTLGVIRNEVRKAREFSMAELRRRIAKASDTRTELVREIQILGKSELEVARLKVEVEGLQEDIRQLQKDVWDVRVNWGIVPEKELGQYML